MLRNEEFNMLRNEEPVPWWVYVPIRHATPYIAFEMMYTRTQTVKFYEAETTEDVVYWRNQILTSRNEFLKLWNEEYHDEYV